MPDQRNIILAIVLSVAIIFAFQFYNSQQLAERQAAEQARAQAEAPGGPPAAPSDVPAPPGASTAPAEESPESRAATLDQTPRIEVDTPRLRGSISLEGGRIDDLTLTEYYETTEPDIPTGVSPCSSLSGAVASERPASKASTSKSSSWCKKRISRRRIRNALPSP